VIDRWNDQLPRGRDKLCSPMIRVAPLAGTPWLDFFCPAAGRAGRLICAPLNRRPLASVGTLVLDAAVLMVSRVGADAEVAGIARSAAKVGQRPMVPRAETSLVKPFVRAVTIPYRLVTPAGTVTVPRSWSAQQEANDGEAQNACAPVQRRSELLSPACAGSPGP
jgi:hypothetical protein